MGEEKLYDYAAHFRVPVLVEVMYEVKLEILDMDLSPGEDRVQKAKDMAVEEIRHNPAYNFGEGRIVKVTPELADVTWEGLVEVKDPEDPV